MGFHANYLQNERFFVYTIFQVITFSKTLSCKFFHIHEKIFTMPSILRLAFLLNLELVEP